MKSKLLIIIVFLLIISVLGSGCKKKIEEKITEKIVEGITGNDVDINKGTTTIKTGNNSSQIGTDLEWPEGIMGGLPKIKANIFSIVEDKNYEMGMVYFDSMKRDDALDYASKLKELGFVDGSEVTSEDSILYMALNNKDEEVTFIFNQDGTGTLTYAGIAISLIPSNSNANSGNNPPGYLPTGGDDKVDMTDDAPWPKDFFKDIPELEGKILEVSSSGSQDKFIYIEYVAKETALDYVEKLKEIGFVDSPYESMSGSYLSYEAGKENEDYIVFNWSDSGYATISLTKSE